MQKYRNKVTGETLEATRVESGGVVFADAKGRERWMSNIEIENDIEKLLNNF